MRDDRPGDTPTELFVAGLAGCVAFFGRRFLARHGLDEEGLRVEAEYQPPSVELVVGTGPAQPDAEAPAQRAS